MTLDELITELQRLRTEHGNGELSVVYADLTPVAHVQFDTIGGSDGEPVIFLLEECEDEE
jgi:hypothetical protein